MVNKKSPIEYFFNLGNKFTGNDPIKKADWDFYLLIIMFIAFMSIGIGNLIEFFKSYKISYLGWTLVMVAILWFQYNSLVQVYNFRKILKTKTEIKVESKDDMLKEFVEDNFKLSKDTKQIFDKELKGGTETHEQKD